LVIDYRQSDALTTSPRTPEKRFSTFAVTAARVSRTLSSLHQAAPADALPPEPQHYPYPRRNEDNIRHPAMH